MIVTASLGVTVDVERHPLRRYNSKMDVNCLTNLGAGNKDNTIDLMTRNCHCMSKLHRLYERQARAPSRMEESCRYYISLKSYAQRNEGEVEERLFRANCHKISSSGHE